MRGAKKRVGSSIRSNDESRKEGPEETRPLHPVFTRNLGAEWSAEDKRFLKQLAKESTSPRVIGLKLGRSVASVRAMAMKMSLPLKPAKRSSEMRR